MIQFGRTVLVPPDQFPVSVANRGSRCSALVAVMGVVPEHRPSVKLLASQQRYQTPAVDMLFRTCAQAGEFKQRRVEISTRYRCLRDGSCLGSPGSADEHRLPDAALVEPALPATEGQVCRWRALRGAQSAVVGHEHNNRSGLQAVIRDRIQHRPDCVVERFDHSCVDGMILHLACISKAFSNPARPREFQELGL